MRWNPEIYLAFADARARPASDLLARIAVDAPGRVADLGCGPGNSTALLAARWPHAVIDGVDSSAEMLADAAASGVHANWIKADIARWQGDAPYDVIYSNAAYQWLGDHAALLPRLIGFVKPGGVFAFQVPNNFDAPSHSLMRAVADGEPWAATLANIREAGVLRAAAYYDILAPHAAELDIWETTYLHVLNGDNAVYRWVSGTGLRPFVHALDGAERDAFVAAYKARLREAYPQRADGKTLFAFRRLFAVVRRGGAVS